ncbi:methyltransferase domain-containing protein [Campylobacter devanensis]|uniref:SAM-dependent methyltransferase n=1 Tax=Campylobacter devanensis TaxID=3161138 RepID=A0A1X9SQQ8_9BACT|nr:class I SAM-dependent methyltransferase [Campylobacter lanienae]ARQ98576.1 SAM-dependent methyltransferase [Campylobacter lanienae]SUX01630.1 methyltransferase domain-containing protein [Campylobacter lanienae]
MREIWNKKSKTYPKFSPIMRPFEAEFFAFLDECGVSFADKSVIDIGAGTGVYSLHLAKMSKSVLALDISDSMLEILSLSAKEHNITNIQTANNQINDIKDRKFDIAFLTMSPALRSNEDFEIFYNLANTHIYMNWLKPRKSDLLELFMDTDTRADMAAPVARLEAFLNSKNIKFQSKEINENRSVTKNIDEMVENLAWHLEISGQNYTKDEIKNKIINLAKGDEISESIATCVKVMIF